MRKITLLIVSMVVMASFSSCEKKDYPPESYMTVGDITYELTTAACYHIYSPRFYLQINSPHSYTYIYPLSGSRYISTLYFRGEKDVKTNAHFAVRVGRFVLNGIHDIDDDDWPQEGIYSPSEATSLKNDTVGLIYNVEVGGPFYYGEDFNYTYPFQWIPFTSNTTVIVNKLGDDLFEISWEGIDEDGKQIKGYYKGEVIILSSNQGTLMPIFDVRDSTYTFKDGI